MTRQREIAEDMRQQFGKNSLTCTDIKKYFGRKKYQAINDLVNGLPSIVIGNREEYLIIDIAKRIAERSR